MKQSNVEELLTKRCCELQARIAVLEDALRQQLPTKDDKFHPRYDEWAVKYKKDAAYHEEWGIFSLWLAMEVLNEK